MMLSGISELNLVPITCTNSPILHAPCWSHDLDPTSWANCLAGYSSIIMSRRVVDEHRCYLFLLLDCTACDFGLATCAASHFSTMLIPEPMKPSTYLAIAGSVPLRISSSMPLAE